MYLLSLVLVTPRVTSVLSFVLLRVRSPLELGRGRVGERGLLLLQRGRGAREEGGAALHTCFAGSSNRCLRCCQTCLT